MSNVVNWFEIPATDIDRAQRFYEAVLGNKMQRQTMGPSPMAVFPYTRGEGVGGALVQVEGAVNAGNGTLVYLNAGNSLDLALSRVPAAGGAVALPRQALPPGLGFFAHIIDLDGNRVGLHVLD